MIAMPEPQLPKISVVTPSFNQGIYIEETIQSVIAQRYPNVEYIIIDGASTDSTVSILEKYQDHFAYWVSEKDAGQTEAINKGLSRATGDLVAILNSDDVYLPGALDYVAKQFMNDPSLRWMTAPGLFFGPGLGTDQADVMITEVPKTKSEWLVRQTIPHPSTFIRRELLDKHGLFDASYYFTMDYEYWCRLAFGGEVCKGFPRPLSGFRLHDASKSGAEQDKRMAGIKAIMDTYLPKLPPAEQAKVKREHAKYWGQIRIYESLWPLRRGDKAEAEKIWSEAVANHPAARFSRAYFTTWLRIKLNRP